MENAQRCTPNRYRRPSPTFTSTHLRDAESGLALAGQLAGAGAVAGLATIPDSSSALSTGAPGIQPERGQASQPGTWPSTISTRHRVR